MKTNKTKIYRYPVQTSNGLRYACKKEAYAMIDRAMTGKSELTFSFLKAVK